MIKCTLVHHDLKAMQPNALSKIRVFTMVQQPVHSLLDEKPLFVIYYKQAILHKQGCICEYCEIIVFNADIK